MRRLAHETVLFLGVVALSSLAGLVLFGCYLHGIGEL